MLYTTDQQYLSWLKPAKICVEVKIRLLALARLGRDIKRTLRQEIIGDMNEYICSIKSRPIEYDITKGGYGYIQEKRQSFIMKKEYNKHPSTSYPPDSVA
jgi:hypothetical protein